MVLTMTTIAEARSVANAAIHSALEDDEIRGWDTLRRLDEVRAAVALADPLILPQIDTARTALHTALMQAMRGEVAP